MGSMVRGIAFGDPATPVSELIATVDEMHTNALNAYVYVASGLELDRRSPYIMQR